MGGSSSSEKNDAPGTAAAGSAPAAAPRSSSTQRTLALNVYSPTGAAHGVYHSGVEVLGAEYVFGGGDTSYSGVTAQRPKVPPPGSGWVFYQSVEIAPLTKSKDEVLRLVQELRSEFPARSYDLVARNCNHFSDALCHRLCGVGIPSWVNRLAGVGASLRSVAGMGPDAAAAAASAGRAEGTGGGPAAEGLVARTVAADGSLSNEVDWASVGVLNASGNDPAGALHSGQPVSSEDDPELLILLPFRSPVKLQAVHIDAPNIASAPSHVRLFANQRNLDMDDAGGGVAPTQDVETLVWAPRENGGSSVGASIQVNFLKFQNLGFLAIHLSRNEEEGDPIVLQGFKLVGRV